MTAGEHIQMRIFELPTTDGHTARLKASSIRTQSDEEVITLQINDGPEVVLPGLTKASEFVAAIQELMAGKYNHDRERQP